MVATECFRHSLGYLTATRPPSQSPHTAMAMAATSPSPTSTPASLRARMTSLMVRQPSKRSLRASSNYSSGMCRASLRDKPHALPAHAGGTVLPNRANQPCRSIPNRFTGHGPNCYRVGHGRTRGKSPPRMAFADDEKAKHQGGRHGHQSVCRYIEGEGVGAGEGMDSGGGRARRARLHRRVGGAGTRVKGERGAHATGLAHLDRPEGVATLTETVTFEEPIIIRFPVGRYTIVPCPFWTFWPRMPPPP